MGFKIKLILKGKSFGDGRSLAWILLLQIVWTIGLLCLYDNKHVIQCTCILWIHSYSQGLSCQEELNLKVSRMKD